jgi:hypothetical protein
MWHVDAPVAELAAALAGGPPADIGAIRGRPLGRLVTAAAALPGSDALHRLPPAGLSTSCAAQQRIALRHPPSAARLFLISQ